MAAAGGRFAVCAVRQRVRTHLLTHLWFTLDNESSEKCRHWHSVALSACQAVSLELRHSGGLSLVY